MTFTNDSKAVITLTTRLGDKDRPSLSPTKWHRLASLLKDAGLAPEGLFDKGFDPSDVPGIDPTMASAIRRLLEDASLATVAASDLGRNGIWIQTIVDDDYPSPLQDRLGRNAPPVIFGVGDKSLLAGDGIGIVGSRNVDPQGADVAHNIAVEATQIGRSVVSGGARGVDQLAMNAAYQTGGSVVGVLADSLLKKIQQPGILTALDSGSTCLITQQVPSATFKNWSAMGRNKLIYALSGVTVVVASDEAKGGTWTGAVEALNNSYSNVAVWRGVGEGPGNAALEEMGATPIRDAGGLKAILDSSYEKPATESEQLGLLESP